jgi:calcineurin-like phosphoesterase
LTTLSWVAIIIIIIINNNNAAKGGHMKTIKLLLELGANVLAQAKNGSTPLHMAVIGEHEETVKLLLELGANVHAQTQNAWTHAAAFGCCWWAIGDCKVATGVWGQHARTNCRWNNTTASR